MLNFRQDFSSRMTYQAYQNLYSSAGKESSCKAGAPVQFLGQEDPLKGWATYSSILGLPLWLSW